MPIIATPIVDIISPGVICAEQLIKAPQTTVSVDGAPILAKLQAIEVRQGQKATIVWTMKDPQGNTIDLSTCFDARVVVRIREVMSMDEPISRGVEIVGQIDRPTEGKVLFTLTAPAVTYPGISNAEIAILENVSGDLIFSNVFYLIVNRGQFGPKQTRLGPPSIAEIRLHLRDSDPADNLWLGMLEFDAAELAACIERPIHYFNDSQPPLNLKFNTTNFPWRYYYLSAIVASLYDMASLHYARVHLPYQQQGGLMVDDKNKAEMYAKIASVKWDEYKDWVLRKKVQLNAEQCFQSIGSPYYGVQWKNPQI